MTTQHWWHCPRCGYDVPPGSFGDVKADQDEHLKYHAGEEFPAWQLGISNAVFQDDDDYLK